MADLIKLKNVDLFWAHLNAVSDMSGKYQVDICNLTPEHLQQLESIGFKWARNREDKPEKGKFFTAKSIHPILTVDSNGKPVTAKVANGSKADVVCSTYKFGRMAPGGMTHGVSIAKLIVTELKEYEPVAVDDDL